MLSNLSLKSFYTKQSNVLEDFYHPCVQESVKYHRISGYFSSAIFDLAGKSFFNFFQKGGRMQLVCSPFLPRQDIEALIGRDEVDSLEILLEDANTRSSALILGYLVANRMIDLRIAISTDTGGILHEKIGIFDDGENIVTFNGSINETYQGWSNTGNRESFDVFLSWVEQDSKRVAQHKEEFSHLWNGRIDGVLVRKALPSFMIKIREIAIDGEKEFTKRLALVNAMHFAYKPLGYQEAIMFDWSRNNNRGIVKLCTGAGKTVVGLLAVKWATEQGLPCVIVVPSKTLMYQWQDEIYKAFGGQVDLLLAGDGNNGWRSDGVLHAYLGTLHGNKPQAVIVILDTACSDEFKKRLRKYDEILFLGDEIHNFGAQNMSGVFESRATARLGLSATPERFRDPEGTSRIFNFFGQILDPVIEISDAISLKRLVPYQYNFEVAYLSDKEQGRWDGYTKKIISIFSRFGLSREEKDESAALLLIQRARIAKKAEMKTRIGLDLLLRNFEDGQRWLVFLEDTEEVEHFSRTLMERGLRSMIYEGRTSREKRDQVVDHLRKTGGIVLSMRCLDEGVDIPEITHAIILASSQNPRQFIQRRGRVLRCAGDDKLRAFIWDVLCLPSIAAGDATKALIFSELARAHQFAKNAENSSVGLLLEAMLADYGLSIEDCLAVGQEDVKL